MNQIVRIKMMLWQTDKINKDNLKDKFNDQHLSKLMVINNLTIKHSYFIYTPHICMIFGFRVLAFRFHEFYLGYL